MSFAEIVEYSDTKLVAFKRIIWTCNFLRSRPMSYHTATKSQVANRIFKLTPIHTSVISQTHWFQWKFCFILLLSLYWRQLSDYTGFLYDVITFYSTSFWISFFIFTTLDWRTWIYWTLLMQTANFQRPFCLDSKMMQKLAKKNFVFCK